MPTSPFGGISTLVHLGIIVLRKSLAVSGVMPKAALVGSRAVRNTRQANSMKLLSAAIMVSVVAFVTSVVFFIVVHSIESDTANAHIITTIVSGTELSTQNYH